MQRFRPVGNERRKGKKGEGLFFISAFPVGGRIARNVGRRREKVEKKKREEASILSGSEPRENKEKGGKEEPARLLISYAFWGDGREDKGGFSVPLLPALRTCGWEAEEERKKKERSVSLSTFLSARN